MIPQECVVLITDKSRDIARSWVDVQPGDVVGEVTVKFIESWNDYGRRVSVRDYWEDPDQEQGRKKLGKALARWALAYCRQETALVRGHDDYQPYSREALKNMLPLLHDPESWSSLSVPSGGGGGSKKLAREGNDGLATYSDLTRAFDLLSPRDKELLVLRYVDDDADWQAKAAEMLQVGDASARMAVSRALNALERALAGSPITHVGRRAMSNAKAQAQTRNAYE